MAAGLRSIIPGMGPRKSEATDVDADTGAADLETVEVAVADSPMAMEDAAQE